MNAHRITVAAVLRILIVALLAPVPVFAGTQQATSATEAAVLRRFKARIDDYMALHKKLEKESPLVTGAENPERVRAAQKALAAKIRGARVNAVQGDIFSPETRTVFRTILQRELQSPRGPEVRRAMSDDAPTFISLSIHMEYPEGWPLASVPPSILAVLPQLPEDLEYRFVGRHMILRDVHANLVIDFIRDAIR